MAGGICYDLCVSPLETGRPPPALAAAKPEGGGAAAGARAAGRHGIFHRVGTAPDHAAGCQLCLRSHAAEDQRRRLGGDGAGAGGLLYLPHGCGRDHHSRERRYRACRAGVLARARAHDGRRRRAGRAGYSARDALRREFSARAETAAAGAHPRADDVGCELPQ